MEPVIASGKLGIFDQRCLFLSALLNYFAIGNVKWTDAPSWTWFQPKPAPMRLHNRLT